VGVEDRMDKSDDYDQFDGMPPFAVEVDTNRLEIKRHYTYVTTMTKELSSRKETSRMYSNDYVQIICVMFCECIPLFI
jgi:copper oxidase (laccase) domain-containing protein